MDKEILSMRVMVLCSTSASTRWPGQRYSSMFSMKTSEICGYKDIKSKDVVPNTY